MTLGQKIKKLRNEKTLTQKDLAEKMNVAFQTVSKWENDENEPDVNTLKELAKLFNVTVDYLISTSDEEIPTESTSNVVITPAPQVIEKETVVIHKSELHVCARCGEEIEDEEDLVSEDINRKERYGRATRTVNVGQRYYHKHCFEEVKQKRALDAKKKRDEQAKSGRKKCFGWGIFAGIVALGIFLLTFLSDQEYTTAQSIIYSVLAGYGMFAMIYCILSGSYICDVFTWCAGLTVKFPGLIFSFDLEGFAWLIGMKILFAILGFLIGVLALLFAIIFSAFLGGISFPFVLIHNIRTDYEDAFD